MCKINGEYVATKEITKIVKKALANRFSKENVSVRKGNGTASSWVEAYVEVERPQDCHCQPMRAYCDRCREALELIRREAEMRVYLDMRSANAQFSSYYSDMDNEPRDCFLLQVSIKR